MAQILPKHMLTILLTLMLFSLIVHAQPHQFSRKLPHKSLGLMKEKLSHLHFYFHDIVNGKHPTAVPIVQAAPTNISSTGFGLTTMIDDPLTVGPEGNSKIVGRAQGLYAIDDLNELSLLMVLNLVFVEGKYNGSTLSILGRNLVTSKVREMPILGGSGLFRFARGYALAKTHFPTVIPGVAVVEYNVYVLHY